MIEHEQEKYGWMFLFLVANIDATKETARFGIIEDRAVTYHSERRCTTVIYVAMREAVCNVRACRSTSADWKRRVDEDYKKRGK